VVKTLLGRKEVNPDQPACWGQTPLSGAVQYENERVVKILLGREEVVPDKPDKSGKTPLMYAIRNGHKKLIARLQEG